jgi:hypothetical protein
MHDQGVDIREPSGWPNATVEMYVKWKPVRYVEGR